MKIKLFLLVALTTVICLYSKPVPPPPPVVPHVEIIAPVVSATTYSISNVFPDHYMPYTEIVTQLSKWNQEAPEITEFDTYGSTKNSIPCYYLRVGTPGMPKLLIHACIHGPERLSTACNMAIIGRYLSDYGKNDEVTWLVKNRDIYFVPVLSPETYLRSREVEGVDPNRSYPCPARPNGYPPSPIRLIMDFMEKHRFVGVMSSHTYGRIYLTPSVNGYGSYDGVVNLAKRMASLSGYRVGSVGSNGRGNGYEIDWYFMQGACAILTEWGGGPTHNMSYSAVKPEFERNYSAFLLFFREAPVVLR